MKKTPKSRWFLFYETNKTIFEMTGSWILFD
jgi:hypothetical protein